MTGPVAAMDPERRRQLLERVAPWLEELTEAEPPPAGLDPEVGETSDPVPDLFSLLGQLAALTRETQLHGRATSRLHADLEAALGRLAESSPELIARRLPEVRREARLELVGELLEVRDRFASGVAEAERRLAALRGIRAWLAPRAVLEALVEGNRLARERLDDLLRRLDVHEIPCLGKPFDPTRMRAVDAERSQTAPPGTVVDVFRPGYTEGGRVLRFAEVKVVDRGSPGTGGHADE